MTLKISRRSALGGIVVGASLAGTKVWAASHRFERLLVIDNTVRGAKRDLVLERFPAAIVVPLEYDVVRQWRTSLRKRFIDNDGGVIVAPWAQSRLYAELAREEGATANIETLSRNAFEVRVRLSRQPLSQVIR